MCSGHKCSYFNCGKTGKFDKDVRFHVFPADVTYSRIWLLNSGNSKLYSLSPKQLRKRYLCSNHFIDSMFMNAVEKHRLIQKAIPKKFTAQPIEQLNEPRFGETYSLVTMCTTSHPKGIVLNVEDNEFNSTSFESLKVLIPKKNYSREPTNILDHKKAASSMFSSTFTVTPDTQNYIFDLPKLPSSSMYSLTFTVSPDTQNYISDLPELLTSSKNYNFPSINYVPLSLHLKKEQLENRCKLLEKLLNRKRSTISYLKKKNLKLLNNKKIEFNSKLFIESMNFESINSKSLVSMQINHKSHKPWASDEKKLSTKLYYKSPSIYKYLRLNKIILPGVSTIRRWQHSITSQ